MCCREAGGEPSSNGCTGAQEEVGSSGQEPQYTHFMCVSPDAPTNPVLYWLGNFDAENTRFLLESAMGPLRLDLGDTLYAPNLLEDHQVSAQLTQLWLYPYMHLCPYSLGLVNTFMVGMCEVWGCKWVGWCVAGAARAVGLAAGTAKGGQL